MKKMLFLHSVFSAYIESWRELAPKDPTGLTFFIVTIWQQPTSKSLPQRHLQVLHLILLVKKPSH